MQGTARAEIFLDELTGFPVQIRPGRRSLPENPGRAAFGIPAETVEDVQVVVDRLRRFDEDRIILIRKQFQFQAGVVIAVIGNGREWRTGPFDAIDGEAVPGEGFLDGDGVPRRHQQIFVGIDHVVPWIGLVMRKIVVVDFDLGGGTGKGTAQGGK